MTPVAEWRWLKVTAGGAPALPLCGAGGGGARRPYECLVLAQSSAAEGPPFTFPPLPAALTLLSPPGAHSRKPRLLHLLRRYAPHAAAEGTGGGNAAAAVARAATSSGDVLELFSRELTSDATAWGNEVLRFQDAALFCKDERPGKWA